MNLSSKKLTTMRFCQISYWVTSAVFVLLYDHILQFKGYSNYEIGIVLLSAILSVLLRSSSFARLVDKAKSAFCFAAYAYIDTLGVLSWPCVCPHPAAALR